MTRYWYFLHAFAAAALLSSAAVAEPGALKGLMCKSPDAVQAFFDYHAQNPATGPQEALAAVNKTEPVCTVGIIVGEQSLVVAQTKLGDAVLDIRRVNVMAVCDQGVCMTVNGGSTVYMALKHEDAPPDTVSEGLPI